MSNRALKVPEAGGSDAAFAGFDFVPELLRSQCRALVTTFHEMHGYSCLPNLLWHAGLAGFIDAHDGLRAAMRKASTTRSARVSNGYFVSIATETLAIELLAREYASWSAIAPQGKLMAIDLLQAGTPPQRTWLMEHYLYPPRYDSRAALVRIAPDRTAPPPFVPSTPQLDTAQ